MADVKISALTSATLPLAGTEVLPIVQSSATKKVATDDLTVKNIRSNATSGLLQVAGPAAASTRVMTVPDANFTAARTDAAQTFTAKQTFSGAASTLASSFKNIVEPATIVAAGANNTINFDVATQSVLYYSSSAAGNWGINFRASSSTQLESVMSNGDVVTVAFLAAQGGTAFYNNAIYIDNILTTPKYQGGTVWAAGNTNSIDVYTYTIIKISALTYTILASQTKFA
jgi:hypothetical protein